ncbi:MAG: c-type cytochrome biogenesis protein CcmI [Pseudohongiella sp.]|nr:c-type cytochrome biogenesis protein CcmI [Pseudohongiella sp.]
MFWILSLLLVVLAVSFVLLPVLRHKNSTIQIGMTARNTANLIIFQERSKELEQDHKEGLLDNEQYNSLKAELERTLLSDVSESSEEHTESAGDDTSLRTPVKLIPVLMVLVLTLPSSYFLYDLWGFRDDLAVAEIFERSRAAGDDPALIRDQIFELGAVVERDPENGWALYFIARHLVTLGQMPEAALFFERAAQFIENPADQAVVLGQYAQAKYIISEQKMTEEVSAIVAQAQRLNPNEPAILQLLGADAFINQDFQAAITYWQRLLNMGPGAEDAAFLRSVIDQAQQMLVGGTQTGSPAQAASVNPVSIEVSLSLAPELQLPGETRVFVSAQQIGGGGPPLAAKLLTIADLPAIISLSDADAVGPFNLSSAEQVSIVATVSLNGTADVQTGDYQVRSDSVALASSEAPVRLQLMIRDLVP